MTNEERDKEIREEIRRAKAAPRRARAGARRTAALVVMALLVLGVLIFAASRNAGGMDRARRRLSYNKVEQDADGKAELFRFDSDRSARYELLGKSLLVVSSTRVALLGEQGEELWSQAVSFSNPAVETGGQTAAVYDVGGTGLYLLGTRGLLRDMSGESGNGILSVSLNGSDYLALTTLKSGCRASVAVYAPSGELVFEFNSSERYVSDAYVIDDNRHLAAVTLGEADGMFASTLTFYGFDSEKPAGTVTLGGSMVLSLRAVGGVTAALQDDRLTLFGADGSLAGSYRFEYPYLRGQSLSGADFAVLLLSRYRSGSALRVVSVDRKGEVLGSLDVRREVLDVSAAGRYAAVLYNDSLTIYRSDLTEYATLSGTDFARRVIMRSDGSALLLGASRAWLYVP